jgi:hypothetical protein
MERQRPQSMSNDQILSVLASGNHGSLTQGDWQAVARMESANINAVNFGGSPIYNYPSAPAAQPQPQPQSQDSGPSSSYSAPSYTHSPPPPQPTPPNPWITTSNYVAPQGIKQADPDVILFNEDAVSPERLIELQYEDVSGIELINISRSDIVDGVDVAYSPVKNLSSLRRKYNPNNIIALPANSSSYFSKFGINLVLRGIYEPDFDDQGNLVIEIANVFEDEIIEAEIDTNGTINLVEFL